MKRFFILTLLSLQVLTVSTSWAAEKKRDVAEENSCLKEDGVEGDQPWELLEKSIPACKRAVVTLNSGARLDLGEKHTFKSYPNGMTALKVKVLSGKGIYSEDERVVPLEGLTLWISLDRCQVRNTIRLNENGKDVPLREARYLETTEELGGIANGDDLKGYKNDCRK